MKKRLAVTVALALLLGISAALWLLKGTDEAPSITFNNEATGLTGQYSSDLEAMSISQQDIEDKFFLRLENRSATAGDELLVRMSYETGLRPLVTLLKTKLIPLLLTNAEKALTTSFDDVKVESRRQYQINSKEAGEIVFTYRGKTGQKVKRRLIIINKDDDTSVNLAAESAEESFARIDDVYFSPLINSLRFN